LRTRLDEAFGSQPLAHWKEVLADFEGVEMRDAVREKVLIGNAKRLLGLV